MKNYFCFYLLFALFLFSFNLRAQQPYALTLQLNNNEAVNVYHDEPVLVTVSVSNKEARENSRLNRGANRRLRELDELLAANKISVDSYDKEKKQLNADKRTIGLVTIGKSSRPWYLLLTWKLTNESTGKALPLKLIPMTNPLAEGVAVLDEKGFYLAYFGLAPEELKQIPGGKYLLITSLEGKNSEPVNLDLSNEDMPGSVANGEEILLREGRYYWHTNEPLKAKSYADKMLQKNPNSIDALSLMGDIQILDRAYQPALDSYNKALKEFYRLNPGIGEEPGYLLGSISWLKGQLGQ